MTEATIKKLHKWFSFLASGNFKSSDFNKEYGDDENAGRMTMGKMSGSRVSLIITDAKRHLKDLEDKHPSLIAAPVEKKTKK